MSSYRVYRLKLKPSKVQAEYLARLFVEAKWFYNHILAQESLRGFDTKTNIITVVRGEALESEELTCLAAQMKQQIYRRIGDNIKSLASRKSNGGRVGKLKFKRAISSIPLSNQTFTLRGGRVKFQKMPQTIRVVGMKQLPEGFDVRKGDLVSKASGYYLHVCIRVEEEEVAAQGIIGLDMGIRDAITLSDGTKINASIDTSKLRRLARAASKKQVGSNNRKKAQKALRLEYERVVNRRDNASNQLMSVLKQYKVVFQDEMIASWQAGAFGRQVSGSILGRVKAALKANPANLMLSRRLPTTQLCPKCKRLNKHDPSRSTYLCPCGYQCDRDVHAARNMLIFGQELADVEKELDVPAKLSRLAGTHLSVKQEVYPYGVR